MDTYGDMVTLLLCFFVLLYSMSTISEENWKAIVQSFNPTAVEDPRVTTGAGGPDADNEGESGIMSADSLYHDPSPFVPTFPSYHLSRLIAVLNQVLTSILQ